MRVTEQAKAVVSEVVKPGERAVDATLGNGHDALFLAELVGPQGQVFGFDVQAAAIESSRHRLQEAGVLERCQLIQAGHERLAEFAQQEVAVVMFNLGYLPGSDKDCVTKGETTTRALAESVKLLREGGVVTVMCYLGHEGGRGEAEAVLEWTRSLDEQFSVEGPVEVPDQEGPFLAVIQKVNSASGVR